MKIKKDSGLTTIDIVIAIVAISIFSTLIFSMMYSNVMENIKLKQETLAMIYITEIFENIGIESYENMPSGDYTDIANNEYDEKIEALIPQEAIDNYKVDLIITNELEGVTNNEDILKKIQLTLTYEAGQKTFNCSMQRMKIKE